MKITKEQSYDLVAKHNTNGALIGAREDLLSNINFLSDLANLLKCQIPPEKLIELAVQMGAQSKSR